MKSGLKASGSSTPTIGKKQISDIIWRCFQTVGQHETVLALDRSEVPRLPRSLVPVAPLVSPTW
jgi:hypothetical protein